MNKFIDEIYLTVQSGSGGKGAISFDRRKYKSVGKPDGGDGGKGGNVILKIDANYSELSHLTKVHLVKAGNGNNGGRSNSKGKDGTDAIIKLPPGVIIKDFETKKNIIEMINDQEEYIIAQGGKGGRGNAQFKSSKNRSPHRSEQGKPGIQQKIIIELKLLADVGLIGFPNAGKSTLLKSFTDAHPEINSYPFTTLTPNLGIFYDEYSNPYSIADIPGLISDAHKGKGLGIRFLKHIERTKILCLIVDLSEKEFKKQQEQLLYELKQYNSELIEKKIIYVGNKIDVIEDKNLLKKYKNDYILISALAKENLDKLKNIFIKAIKDVEK